MNTQTKQIHQYNTALSRGNREGGISTKEDILAVEEPLEIIIGYGSAGHRQRKTISVTMRTPDHDAELALGFLYTEGVIAAYKDIANVRHIDENRLLVDLHDKVVIDFEKLNRHFYTTSSCGVCGKASLEAVSVQSCFIFKKDFPKINTTTLLSLPVQLLDNQLLFTKTGGTHASVLFTLPPLPPQGVICAETTPLLGAGGTIYEDVGRHNALDKAIGWALKRDILPLSNHILLVSGRASFELIQKAAMAGIPIVAAIGAPSSLAVQLAEEMGMTLVGFLKGDRFNIYTGVERII
jgi:FdhD protein